MNPEPKNESDDENILTKASKSSTLDPATDIEVPTELAKSSISLSKDEDAVKKSQKSANYLKSNFNPASDVKKLPLENAKTSSSSAKPEGGKNKSKESRKSMKSDFKPAAALKMPVEPTEPSSPLLKATEDKKTLSESTISFKQSDKNLSLDEILTTVNAYFKAANDPQPQSTSTLTAITTVDGIYDAMKDFAESRHFIYFVASNNASGESWCADCRRAKPNIDKITANLPDNVKWYEVHTGRPRHWYDDDNVFRLAFNIERVPTLIEFGTNKRLVESELENMENILNMLKPSDELPSDIPESSKPPPNSEFDTETSTVNSHASAAESTTKSA